MLSIDDGATYPPRDPSAAAAFSYYDPFVPPRLDAISTPEIEDLPGGVTRAASDDAGGTLVILTGANLAPTPKLACLFGEAVVYATFVDVHTAHCLTPNIVFTGVQHPNSTVKVRPRVTSCDLP